MTKVLIVEDEMLAADELQSQLRELRKDYEVLSTIDSVKDTRQWLMNHEDEVDLIFMDIHLTDGVSFEIFDQIKVKTPVIFTTAYNDYAIQAFKVNSIDYLLKPIEIEDLKLAIEKFEESRPAATKLPSYEELYGLLSSGAAKRYRKRFMVALGERFYTVESGDIAYFMGEDKYVFIVTHDGRRFIFDNTLSAIEQHLDPETFFRVNRSFITSFKAIKGMHAYSRSRIKVELHPDPETEKSVVVSTEKAKAFREWLNK